MYFFIPHQLFVVLAHQEMFSSIQKQSVFFLEEISLHPGKVPYCNACPQAQCCQTTDLKLITGLSTRIHKKLEPISFGRDILFLWRVEAWVIKKNRCTSKIEEKHSSTPNPKEIKTWSKAENNTVKNKILAQKNCPAPLRALHPLSNVMRWKGEALRDQM